MDKKLKKRWVAALRSGNYRQARESLIDRSGSRARYCCLGVLCRVSGAEFSLYSGCAEFPSGNLTNTGTLGPDILDEVGLYETDAEVLMEMNDTEKKSFKEIADYIEKNI
mgnify:CR=1 FL=1